MSWPATLHCHIHCHTIIQHLRANVLFFHRTLLVEIWSVLAIFSMSLNLVDSLFTVSYFYQSLFSYPILRTHQTVYLFWLKSPPSLPHTYSTTPLYVQIPFGIAQIGKAFRNEITPRNFIFRSREFEQMEIEYFIPDGDEDWGPVRSQNFKLMILCCCIIMYQGAEVVPESRSVDMNYLVNLPILHIVSWSKQNAKLCITQVVSATLNVLFLFSLNTVPREVDIRKLELVS